MDRKPYPSDLNDAEWAILEPRLPQASKMGRPRKHPMREMMNALFYVMRAGCSWRMLPHDLPPWQTVYRRMSTWSEAGIWEDIHGTLRDFVRIGMGREPHPTAVVMDSQSVKTTEKGGSAGTTRGKRSKGARGISSSTHRALS